MNRSRLVSALLLVLSLAIFASPSGAQPPDGFARSRTVDVQQPGWVATRLGATTAAHVGVDLTVFGPDGRSLKVYRLDEQEGRRGVQVTALEPGSEGAGQNLRAGRWVRLDLGADPPRHFRLEFIASERVEAPDCVLQASADGRSWTELVRGGLFRLGDDAALQRLALDYPASDARYLRLFWPGTAGTPALERVGVLAEGDAVESMGVAADCTGTSNEQNRRTCRLQLGAPARQARRLDLTLEDPGTDPNGASAIGWRLWSAQNGSWRLLSEGVRRATGERGSDEGKRVVRIALDEGTRWKLLSDAEDPVLRLEVWGGEVAPFVTKAQLRAARSAIAFQAQTAGRHVIAWGGSKAHGAFSEGAPVGDEVRRLVAWVEAGGTMTAPWPRFDARLAAPGKDFDAKDFSRSRPVTFDVGVKPGDVVRVEFGASVRTGTHLMRLAFGGKLVPWVEQEVDEPAPAGSMRFRPEAESGSRRSRAEISGLRGGEAAYSQLLLRAQGPFQRRLSLGTTVPGRRGRPPTRKYLLHETEWSCLDTGPLPCALDQNAVVAGFDQTELELTVDDGDDLPLPWVDLELWRPRAALLFVAPKGLSAENPVMLYAADPEAGDPRPAPPRFDLDALSSLLRLRPHVPARLGDAETALDSSPFPVDWLLYGALAVAVLVLLALLGRMLREPAGG